MQHPSPAADARSPRDELEAQRAMLARLRGEPGGLAGRCRRGPMIVDTDIGSDPDDAFALAVAALEVAELELDTSPATRPGHLRAATGSGPAPRGGCSTRAGG